MKADAADAALAKGESRALLGVPMTVKEHYAGAGLPTTRGDPKYKDWKAEVDAVVVQRLKSTGAVKAVDHDSSHVDGFG